MAVLTVTAKGQVTLKKDVMRHLGLKPGDRIAVDLLPEGKATLSAATVPPKRDLGGFFGSLHRPGEPTVTLEDMDAAIREGWAGRR